VAGLLGGSLILLYGRRFFWFVSALAGVTLGYLVIGVLTDGMGPAHAAAALAAGAAAGLLAVASTRLTAALFGFLIAGTGAVLAADLLLPPDSWVTWPVYMTAGLAGAALMLRFFDWAAILLTALLGAAIVAATLCAGAILEAGPSAALWLLLFPAGAIFQATGRPHLPVERRGRRQHRVRST